MNFFIINPLCNYADLLLFLSLKMKTDNENEVTMLQPTSSTVKGWKKWMPGLQTFSNYKLSWLTSDISAGIVLTTMLIPVGIAYAEASGVPGIYGLYATIVPLLAYALFGPSRIMVLGPDSSLAAIILAVLLPLSVGDPNKAVALAGMMAIVSGLVCILAGVFRLGFITELLSKPIRYGYMNGIALTVLISQLPKAFGFSIETKGPLMNIYQIGASIVEGNTNPATFAIGLGTFLVIIILKPYKRIPGILIAVIGATLAAGFFDLNENYGVKVLGSLPHGLPSFVFPMIALSDLQAIVIGGCAVALVSFADTSVLSRIYAAKTKTYVDPNQEMVGLGAANFAAGFFQGFPISSSSSRTPVAEASGSKTQFTGVVGAVAVAMLLLFGGDLLKDLPTSALAAVVISSAIGLFEFNDLRRIFRIQRWEFWLSIVCFLGVAVLGAIPGIGLAIVISIIEFLWDGWRPHYTILGRVEGIRGYHDVKRYPDALRIPGLVLFRWDAPLFFANAELFQEQVLKSIADSPTPVRRFILAAEPITSVDITSADVLVETKKTLQSSEIELCIAEMKDPVKDKLKKFEIFQFLGPDMFHPTIGAAVDEYLKKYGIEWKH